MSENLSRKGIAFGAMVALGASLMAGAPASANANGPLTLLPDGGTLDGATYTSLIGTGITLSSDLDADKQTIVQDNYLNLNADGASSSEWSIARSFDGDYDLDTTTGAADRLAFYQDLARVGTPTSIPGSFVYSASVTASQAIVESTTPAVDPISEAFWVIENPAAASIKLTIDSEDIGYYIYNDDGNAFGYTGSAVAALTLGDEDYSASGVSVTIPDDDAEDTYTTNATKIAVLAADASNDTAGARSIADLHIDAVDADEDTTIELDVTVMVDDQNGADSTTGKVNNGEYVSATQTITLLDSADVSVTTAMDATLTTRGDHDHAANVTIGSGVNMYSVLDADSFGVIFFKDGDEILMEEDEGTVDVATHDGADYVISDSSNASIDEDGTLLFSSLNEDEANLASGVYTARAVYLPTTPDQYVGARSVALDLRDGTNADVTDIYATIADTDNIDWDETADSLVRAGNGAVTASLQINDTNNEDLDDAGVRVRVTVTATTLDDDSTVTVGGTTLADEDSVTYTAFTDGNGQVAVNFNNTGAVDGDVVDLSYSVLLDDGTYESGTTQTFTWADTDYETYTQSPAGALAGSTVNVTYTAKDQWGVGIDSTEDGRVSFQVKAVVDGVIDETVYSETENTTNGSASFSFSNFATAGSNQEIIVYKYEGDTADSGTYVTVYNNLATGAIVMNEEFDVDVEYIEWVTGDLTDPVVSAAATELVNMFQTDEEGDEFALISGTVLDANNAGQPGEAVTISADGVLFYDEDTEILAENSITVYANAQGFFDVKAAVHTVNTTGRTVTVTSGGVTQTALLKSYLETGIQENDLLFSYELPEVIVKDTTYVLPITLTDVYGNPVRTVNASEDQVAPVTGGTVDAWTTDAIRVTAAGSIQVNGVDEVEKNTASNGVATVFIRSVNDIAGPGSISVVLAEDFNYYTGRSGGAIGDTTNTSTVSLDDEDTSWNESLWTNTLSDDVDVLEEAPAPTGKVNVGSFNGKLVVYALGLDGAKISWKVAGKWGVAYANGDTLNRFDRPVGASGVPVNVDIYVNGVKQLTKTVTTR